MKPWRGVRQIASGVRAASELSGVGVEKYKQVPVFVQRLIILVAQTIAHGEVGPDLPFVLRVKDQVILFQESIAGRTVIPRIGDTGVAQDLDLARRVREQRRNI